LFFARRYGNNALQSGREVNEFQFFGINDLATFVERWCLSLDVPISALGERGERDEQGERGERGERGEQGEDEKNATFTTYPYESKELVNKVNVAWKCFACRARDVPN
jgi:hypothetical protein